MSESELSKRIDRMENKLDIILENQAKISVIDDRTKRLEKEHDKCPGKIACNQLLTLKSELKTKSSKPYRLGEFILTLFLCVTITLSIFKLYLIK